METPDKIYFPADGLPSYIDWDGSPICTKQVEDSDVCYIRKDALLEPLREKRKAITECSTTKERKVASLSVIDFLIDKINSL